MKRTFLFMAALAFLLVACAAPNNKKEWRGIDYSAYEMPALSTHDDYVGALPQPSILQENQFAQDAEEMPSADEDFTSEEIASSYGRYTDVTVVAATKRVKLGANATTKQMALFQKALDNGYKRALRTYHPSGFTYSIASVGAVNPLSDIEVSCILDEHAASDVGQPTCNLFFNTLVQQYNNLLKEAQANAAL